MLCWRERSRKWSRRAPRCRPRRMRPDKLPWALAAEQSAYQALLKATPREYRLNRSRKGQGGSSTQKKLRTTRNSANSICRARRTDSEPTAGGGQPDTAATRAGRERGSVKTNRAAATGFERSPAGFANGKSSSQHRRKPAKEIERQLKRLRTKNTNCCRMWTKCARKWNGPGCRCGQTKRSASTIRSRRVTTCRRRRRSWTRNPCRKRWRRGRAPNRICRTCNNMLKQSSSQFSNQMRQMRSKAREMAERENQIARDLDAFDKIQAPIGQYRGTPSTRGENGQGKKAH